MKLGRLDVQISDGRIALAGRLDEASPLSALASQIPPGDIAIETGGVTFVNSVGMREWLRFVRALRDRGAVTLERVADVLMTQLNMIPELAGVRIASFHAQYECPSCGAESAPLIDAVVHVEALRAMTPPRLPCAECRAPMELADYPERYLLVFRRGLN